MTQPEPSQLERFAAAAFYAPIGLGAQLVDDFPATVAKARQQIALARFVGKMAVDQGAKQVRERLVHEDATTPTSPPSSTATSLDVAEPDDTEVGDVAELALPDYDQLPAAHIVGKLDGLTQAERNAIEAYEIAGRHRRTVLGKLDQLRES